MTPLRFLIIAALMTGAIPGQRPPVFGQEAEAATAKGKLDEWFDAFAIERPWEDLAAMPDEKKRHRGALAHVFRQLNRGTIPAEARDHLLADLAGLLAIEAQPAAVDAARPAFTDYREHFRIDVFRLWKQLIAGGGEVPLRWNAGFREIYYSQAEGAGVPFEVRLPPEMPDRDRYPLVVVIKGGPRVAPSEAFPFIQVRPSRGGIWGYRTLSGYDAMRVIDFMKRHYPVDPDRIYLPGSSAGASGAMHLASCFPDEFAAVMPLVATGTNYPIANFRNLPVAIHHGVDDWTSAIAAARVQHQKLKKEGCPVFFREYPGVGHSVPGPHEPLMAWFFQQKRDRSPETIRHECETPSRGRSYWIHIRKFQDPHRRASVEASVDFSAAGGGTVKVRPENVAALEIDLERLISGNGGRAGFVEIGGERIDVRALAGACRFRREAGTWRVVDAWERPAKRPYEAGAAANLYQGEPLLIVYGTGGPRTDRLRAAARKLAACGGPAHSLMRDHHFPVIADRDLKPEQEARCHLVLVGTPEENRVTAAILPKLPIVIREGELITGGRAPLPLRDRVLSLLHPHPEFPEERLVYLVAPFTDEAGLAKFGAAPQHFLAGSDGFDRISQPDLRVRNLDGRIAREQQFGHGWKWIETPGGDVPVPDRFADRTALAAAYMEVMKRKSGADYALWWGPADRGMWGYDFNFLSSFDPGSYTRADFATRHGRAETLVAEVSGLELKDIRKRWGENREMLFLPGITGAAIDDGKTYRLHLPMDLYIKLGQRKKTLTNPKAGPEIAGREVMEEVFQ